jgi:LysM repeat protein
LREAPPKLVTVGAPALLALLLVALVATQWQRVSPIAWVRENLMRGVVIVENVGASIEPEVVIVMTPIVPDSSGASDSVIVSDTQSVAMAAESLVTPLPDPNVTPEVEQSILAAAVTQSPPMGIGGPQPEGEGAEATGAPESLPAESLLAEASDPAIPPTPQPSPTSMPTLMPTVTPPPPTPTPEAVDEGGDEAQSEQDENSAGGMAAAVVAAGPTNMPTPTWTTIATGDAEGGDAAEVAAQESAQEESVQVAALAASGATLPTPLPTATATPTTAVTPLPTPTPTPLVYQVRAGDTLVTIAAAYDVEVDALMAANNISEQDVFRIQPGQMLIVPVPAPEPVSVAGDLSAVRLEQPTLLVPSNGASVGCATGGKLIWQRVQFVKDSDSYVLHLGFVSGRSNGEEAVTWVVEQRSPVTQTEWQLDTSLCGLASDDMEHQWRWWVEVVEARDGETVSVSPPSEVWGFTWE